MLARPALGVLTACIALLFVMPTSTAVALPRPLLSEGDVDPSHGMTPDQALEQLKQVERIIDRAEGSGRLDIYTAREYRVKLAQWRLEILKEQSRQSVMEMRRRMPWLHDVDAFDQAQVWDSVRRYKNDQRRQVRERLYRERGITPP